MLEKPSDYKPHVYKKKRKTSLFNEPTGVIPPEQEKEELTGYVRDLPASQYEERVARSFRKYDIGYEFQFEIDTLTSLPGQEPVIDFMTYPIYRAPVEVYGEIGHTSPGDKANDKVREDLINQELLKMGRPPLVILWWWELETQEQSDATIAEKVV